MVQLLDYFAHGQSLRPADISEAVQTFVEKFYEKRNTRLSFSGNRPGEKIVKFFLKPYKVKISLGRPNSEEAVDGVVVLKKQH